MNIGKYHQAAIFEHRFWLQILGDHSRMILDTLAPGETRNIQQAQCFIAEFDRLLSQAKRVMSDDDLYGLTEEAYSYAANLRRFKLELLQQQLVDEVNIGLSPTFLNHMVNELEEYLEILENVKEGKLPPVKHPVHHHLLWLLDAVGHAAAIACELDLVEKQLRQKGEDFMRNFRDLYLKAVELSGCLRTGSELFPALSRFNSQSECEIYSFMGYLDKIKEMLQSNRALGRLPVLIPDHMLREECYYLTKLAQVSEIDLPECDPTRPRVE